LPTVVYDRAAFDAVR